MSALDISVINTVLPVVTRDFNTQVATAEWAVIIYLRWSAGFSRFWAPGDLYGHKLVFITGFCYSSSARCCVGSPPA